MVCAPFAFSSPESAAPPHRTRQPTPRYAYDARVLSSSVRIARGKYNCVALTINQFSIERLDQSCVPFGARSRPGRLTARARAQPRRSARPSAWCFSAPLPVAARSRPRPGRPRRLRFIFYLFWLAQPALYTKHALYTHSTSMSAQEHSTPHVLHTQSGGVLDWHRLPYGRVVCLRLPRTSSTSVTTHTTLQSFLPPILKRSSSLTQQLLDISPMSRGCLPAAQLQHQPRSWASRPIAVSSQGIRKALNFGCHQRPLVDRLAKGIARLGDEAMVVGDHLSPPPSLPALPSRDRSCSPHGPSVPGARTLSGRGRRSGGAVLLDGAWHMAAYPGITPPTLSRKDGGGRRASAPPIVRSSPAQDAWLLLSDCISSTTSPALVQRGSSMLSEDEPRGRAVPHSPLRAARPAPQRKC